jgi:AdoMet-dependent heme synthase
MNYEPHPIVTWELTRECDLACRGCPLPRDAYSGSNELSTYESYKTIDQILDLAPREFFITGGDPLEREDVYQIVDYSRRRGLLPVLVVSPTKLLTAAAIERLQRVGLTRIVVSIDGSTPKIHERVHAVPHSFANTLEAIDHARAARISVEVNTLVTHGNAADLPAIAELLATLAVVRWNLYFIVPTGDSRQLEALTSQETEQVFETIAGIADDAPFAVRVVEAPHYRRFLLQRNLRHRLEVLEDSDHQDVLDSAIGGASSSVYISHSGDVRASEFLALSAGNLRYRPLSLIYRGSDLFSALRDAANLKGRCGRCEYRHVCGGSRARSFATTSDVFASDPLCAYEPPEVAQVPPMARAPEANA